MTITRVGAASVAGNTVETLTLTHGLTINDGDVILFCLNADNDGDNRDSEPSVDTVIQDTDELSGHVWIAYKVASAAEPSSYQWTFSNEERCVGEIAVYRGADTTTPLDSRNKNGPGSPSTQGTFSSLTPTQDGCAVVCYISCQEGNVSVPSFSSWPATTTERTDSSTPGGGSGAKSAGHADVIQTTATAVSGTVAIGHGDSTSWACHVIAIAPDTSGSGTVIPVLQTIYKNMRGR